MCAKDFLLASLLYSSYVVVRFIMLYNKEHLSLSLSLPAEYDHCESKHSGSSGKGKRSIHICLLRCYYKFAYFLLQFPTRKIYKILPAWLSTFLLLLPVSSLPPVIISRLPINSILDYSLAITRPVQRTGDDNT